LAQLCSLSNCCYSTCSILTLLLFHFVTVHFSSGLRRLFFSCFMHLGQRSVPLQWYWTLPQMHKTARTEQRDHMWSRCSVRSTRCRFMWLPHCVFLLSGQIKIDRLIFLELCWRISLRKFVSLNYCQMYYREDWKSLTERMQMETHLALDSFSVVRTSHTYFKVPLIVSAHSDWRRISRWSISPKTLRQNSINLKSGPNLSKYPVHRAEFCKLPSNGQMHFCTKFSKFSRLTNNVSDPWTKCNRK